MRGQASIEALMIIAAVLVVLAVLLLMGQRDNEVNNAIAAARVGANEAIAGLALNHGVDIDIERWDLDGDNIKLYLWVQGGPPPDDQTIISAVRDNALDQISQAVGGGYDVYVVVERVTK